MTKSEYWEQSGQTEWEDLARRWLAELRGNVPTLEQEAGGYVGSMSYDAPPETQWQFILIAVSLAESDEELAHVAAGPLEYFLGYYGEDYISLVEDEMAANPKFARALTGVWQFRMSDEVWSRLATFMSKLSDPPRASTNTTDT
jgi:hypothetical protein